MFSDKTKAQTWRFQTDIHFEERSRKVPFWPDNFSGLVWTGGKKGQILTLWGVQTKRLIEGLLSVSLGFLDHVRRASGKKPLTPEVFNSGHVIEANLNFLRVVYFCAVPFLP